MRLPLQHYRAHRQTALSSSAQQLPCTFQRPASSSTSSLARLHSNIAAQSNCPPNSYAHCFACPPPSGSCPPAQQRSRLRLAAAADGGRLQPDGTLTVPLFEASQGAQSFQFKSGAGGWELGSLGARLGVAHAATTSTTAFKMGTSS